jgi:signal transduction histidine kinase
MAEVVEDLRAGRPLEAEWNIADEAVAALNDAQVAESLQILREAVSNALRHGGADHLRIRLQQTEQGTELSVRDNGAGFTPRSGSANGYGLANMEARAQSAAGVLELTSTPGSGTCVQILWQTAPSL